VHESAERMAGFNLYEIAEDGPITAIESYLYDESKRVFTEASIPHLIETRAG
jgi:hypothetical protein